MSISLDKIDNLCYNESIGIVFVVPSKLETGFRQKCKMQEGAYERRNDN